MSDSWALRTCAREILRADEPVALDQVVFDKPAELVHGCALQWVDIVESDLSLVAEQRVEQEHEQPVRFAKQAQVSTGDQAIGGADKPLDCSDHGWGRQLRSLPLQ